MAANNIQFHISFSKSPVDDLWPNGCWSLSQINGDEIANRVVFEKIVKPTDGPAHYSGKVIARHSWPGFIGCYSSLDGVAAAIKKITG